MAEQNYTEEVDLNHLMRKFSNFFKKCIRAVFMVLNFFIKYWIVTLILLFIGVGYGYYKDNTTSKVFKNEGIVVPNFESVDYLYNTIEEFNERINNGDSIFLKKFLGQDYAAIKTIEIEPISDIYNMMTKSREQIDVFRILYQNQEIDKFVENVATNKYFKFHKITFIIKGENKSEAVIEDILAFWNSNEHFREYEKIYRNNAEFQVLEYEKMIAQVDSIVKAITTSSNQNQGVVISENSSLHLLLERKKDMLNDLLKAKIRLSDYTEPIKMVYMHYDIEQRGFSNKVKYPIILLFFFGSIFFIRFLFIRMKRIAES